MTTFEAARLEAAGRWNTRVLLRRYAVRSWTPDAGPLARRIAKQHPAPAPVTGPAWLARLTAKEFHA